MLNSPLQSGKSRKPEDVERIVKDGPHGAIALASVATFLVVAIWLAFYVFVFIPRGGAQ